MRFARGFFARGAHDDDDDATEPGDAGSMDGWMGASIIWCRDFFEKNSKSSERQTGRSQRDATDGSVTRARARDGSGIVMVVSACVTDGVLNARDAM